MAMTGKLTGKTALVTGGASGIGFSIAQRFAQEGATVCVADLDQERCDAAVATIGSDAFGQVLDVRDTASIEAAVKAVVARPGRLDVLVNAAGVFGMGKIVDLAPEDFDRIFDVNTKGLLFTIQAGVRQMLAQGQGGAIVTVASDVARRATPGAVCYSASKAAAVSIAQATALEYADHGIRSNCIAPGAVRTPMWHEVERRFSETLGVPIGGAEAAQVAATPLGRMADPDEMAGIAVFMASDDASYMTGQTVNIDGGMFCS